MGSLESGDFEANNHGHEGLKLRERQQLSRYIDASDLCNLLGIFIEYALVISIFGLK